MTRLRWLMITLALPLMYLAVLYQATRPPKPIYTFAHGPACRRAASGGKVHFDPAIRVAVHSPSPRQRIGLAPATAPNSRPAMASSSVMT